MRAECIISSHHTFPGPVLFLGFSKRGLGGILFIEPNKSKPAVWYMIPPAFQMWSHDVLNALGSMPYFCQSQKKEWDLGDLGPYKMKEIALY